MKTSNKIETKEVDVGFRYLLVSLFLAVLAFFIVLNSISQVNQEKTNEFFDKVQEEFVGDNLLNKFNLMKKKQKVSGGANNTINIKNVIHDFLVNKSVLVISDFTDYGKVLEITLTTGAIFNTNSDYPKTSATKFFRDFAELMKEQRKIHNFNVVTLMGYEEKNPNQKKLTIDRIHAINEKLKYNLKNMVNAESYILPYPAEDRGLNFVKILIYI